MDVLELDSRREVFHLIERKPGIHLRGLQRNLGMAMGALEYHLEKLSNAGLIRFEKHAHKRFYPMALDRRDAPILAAMRAELPRRILIILALQPMPRRQLMKLLDRAPSTVNHHLGRLMMMGMVQDVGDVQVYEHDLIVPDADRVQALYVRHRAGFLDRWIDGFLAATDALRPPPSQK